MRNEHTGNASGRVGQGRTQEREQTAVRCENRQQFGAFLKDIRERAKVSRPELSRRSSLDVSQIYFIEAGKTLAHARDLAGYFPLAERVGLFPEDLITALFTIEDSELRAKEERSLPPTCEEVDWSLLTSPTCDLELAKTDPKAFLQNARWLPTLAQIRIEKLDFYKPYLSLDFVKEYCAFLAKDAMNMLAQYKEVGALFDELAGDQPGYSLVKRQFYFGETLQSILQSESWTRRWAQTLQARALKVFQERVNNEYV